MVARIVPAVEAPSRCASCRFDTDWVGRLIYAGCVRCDKPKRDDGIVLDTTPRVFASHGNTTSYNAGCRCWRCRAARADWYKGKKEEAA